MKDRLTKYEKEILESFERGEWVSVDNLEQEIARHRQIAANTFKKDKRINIRISEKDLTDLKIKAREEGLPYQTLVSSVLHKYLNGRLVERS